MSTERSCRHLSFFPHHIYFRSIFIISFLALFHVLLFDAEMSVAQTVKLCQVLQQPERSGDLENRGEILLVPARLAEIDLVVKPKPIDNEADRVNAHVLYPFGGKPEDFNGKAAWFLTPNGTFIFIPAGQASYRLSKEILTGKLIPENGSYEIHAEHRTPWQTTTSLDGWIIPIQDGFRLDVMHIVSYGGYWQVERIQQVLTSIPSTDERKAEVMELLRLQLEQDWGHLEKELGPFPQSPAPSVSDSTATAPEVSAPTDASQPIPSISDAAEEDLAPNTALSEQQDYIEQVPLQSVYDVVLEGIVDGVSFGPTQGFLQIGSREEEGGACISLLLASNEFDKPGTLMWSNTRRSSTPMDPLQTKIIGKVEINGSVVAAELEEQDAGNASAWMTVPFTGSNPSDESEVVAMSRGKLRFEVKGEENKGEVRGEGKRMPLSRVASTFQATFKGHQRVSKLVNQLRAETGMYRYDGSWNSNDMGLGSFHLIQKGAKLEGVSIHGGLIQARLRQRMISLILSLSDSTAERGFFVLTDGGQHLVGYLGNSEKGRLPRLVVAKTAVSDPIKVPSVTKQDIYAGRTLARDLVSAGKCRQAIAMLDPIYRAYSEMSKADQKMGTLKSWEKEDSLVQRSAALHPLIACSSELGDYQRLIGYLGDAMEITNFTGPKTDVRRLIDDRIANSKTKSAGFHHTFSLIEKNLTSLQRTADFGDPGISYEVGPGNALVITHVGNAAVGAGIAPGDVIVAIDGKTMDSNTVESGADRLRGAVGSIVEVSVRREKKDLKLVLKRQVNIPQSPERKAQYIQALEQEIAGLTRVQSVIAEGEHLEERTATPKAMLHLQAIFNDQAKRLLEMRQDTVYRAHSLYKGYPDLLYSFDEVLRLIASLKANAGNVNVDAIRAADEKEKVFTDQLQLDKTLSGGEKNLIYQQMSMAGVLECAAFELSSVAELIGKLKVEERYKERSKSTDATTARLSGHLAQWRQRLLTDQAKISSQKGDQDFFRKAVLLYNDIDLSEQGLVIAEAGRTRAFADLLAGRIALGREGAPTVVGSTVVSEANAPPLTIDEINKTVKKSASTVIEYFVGNGRISIWVITPDGRVVPAESVGTESELNLDIREFVDLVEKQESLQEMESDKKKMSRLLERFYDLLIRPVKELLPTSPDAVVTIVPYGSLFRLPFAAFKESGAARYLVENHTLVYAPSIGVLRYIQQLRQELPKQKRQSLLAFVNPRFGSITDLDGKSLPPLAATEESFNAISRQYGDETNVLAGSEATKRALLANGAVYDVIFFATHAQAKDDDPQKTYIALAGDYVRLVDIAALRLHAQLVVLQACQTGRGEVTGDGVEGLTRYFVGSGVPSVLSTLWGVGEKTSLSQMYHFHKYWIEKGYSKAAALRQAQLLELGDDPEHVKAWAGYTLTGTWQ